MKNLLKNTAKAFFLFQAVFILTGSFAFAQNNDGFDDWGGDNSGYSDYSNYDSGYGNYDSGYSWDDNFSPYTPANNDFDNTYWNNAATYTGTYDCVGCNSSYVAPTYTTPSYTSPSYTTPNYSNYTSPSYTNYTSPNYSNYTSPSYTYTNTNNVTGHVITNIICPAGSILTNGQCISTVTGRVITTTVCPTGTVLNGTNCINTVNGNIVTNIVCPTGMTLTNGQCINTINGNVVTNVVCPAGTTPNGNTCVNTVTGNVVTNVVCPAGTTLSNGQCINTVTPPVTTVTNCPPNTRLINGTCQQIVTPPITTPIFPPQIVKFNNVVTSIATQITNTSGRCNGIGLIANNAQSTGWFEYGDTPALGRTTASAAIGSSATAPFSNVLASLRPSTKYYCRAVMQNQYGIVKGEIVSFVTTATSVSYVKPPVHVPVSTPVKKPAVITCSDGTILNVDNKTVSSMISKGEKLVALQIEKVEGNLSSGSNVRYKVMYKNLVDTRLTGVVIKVTLPQEVLFASSNSGVYDPMTRTLTLNQDSIDPYTEGVILISGMVVNDAPLGKTIVTNAYAAYTVPTTHAQDEVTAYVVGSIVPAVDTINKDTGAKNVIGANSGKGFMPNSLIEWLALIAILFIIFILGRSIYASYKDDEAAKHH